MPVTPDEISSAALAVAVVSAAFTGVTAVAARRTAKAAARSAAAGESATAGEASAATEDARGRRETRRPELSGRVAFINERSRELTITLESGEALSALQLSIPQEQLAWFVSGAPGVHDPQPGESAPRRASAFDSRTGKAGGLRPRQSVTWALTVSFDRGREVLRIEADCRDEHGSYWPAMLVDARIEPDIMKTAW